MLDDPGADSTGKSAEIEDGEQDILVNMEKEVVDINHIFTYIFFDEDLK